MFVSKRLSSSIASPLSSSLFAGVSAFALSASLFACVIEEGPPRRLQPDTTPSSPSTPVADGTSGGGTTTTPPTTPASPSPMLAVVDTDQVMHADPGPGVGVFSEYLTGGRGHIWWTCDTTISKQECDVSLSATAASGTIANIDAAELSGGQVASPTPSRLEARVKTSTQVHGITFATTPGAVLTLEATIGGLKEGPGPNKSFFFFVQDGKINGGYVGPLTNPLQLQGKSP